MKRSAVDKSNGIVLGEESLLTVRLAIVNFSPAIKRFFWWQPELYWLLSVTALLATFRLSLNRYRLAFSVLILAWVYVFLAPDKALYLYLPALIVWTFSIALPYEIVERSIWRLRHIFVLSIFYGVFQKVFGYFPHEMEWIQSGIGAVREEGYFVTTEIRSFSFYAGVPEFGFFSAIMMFLAIQRRSVVIFAFAVFGIYLAGSRGVMLSAVIALVALFFYREKSPKLTAGAGVMLAIVVYLFLAIILPLTGFLEVKSDESRLFVYGTFNYRVTMLLELVSEIDFANIWYGIRTERQLFDNFYLTLLNDFGIIAVLVFLVWFVRKVGDKSGVYIAVLVLSYCLYADALFSVYFLFNALLLLNARPSKFLEPVECAEYS